LGCTGKYLGVLLGWEDTKDLGMGTNKARQKLGSEARFAQAN